MVGIHGAGEHAPELQISHLGLEVDQIPGHGIHGRLVLLVHRHGQQIGDVSQSRLHTVDGLHHQFQARPLPAQGLGALGLVPDLGVLQFQPDLGQTLFLILVVKDTP